MIRILLSELEILAFLHMDREPTQGFKIVSSPLPFHLELETLVPCSLMLDLQSAEFVTEI